MAEAPARPASVADFTFQVADKTAEELQVTGFTGTEEISRLFSFSVSLCSDDPEVAFDQIVGKPCVLEIASASGWRSVNGIVRRFERTGEGSSLTYYTAEIVPAHWLLTQRHRSRIFQQHNCPDMTVPGIIRKVFQDAGISEDRYRFALQATYDTREYVVQYRESEMDFVSRLMEEEGIFYFFEHDADSHVMVIGDSPTAHRANPNGSAFAFRTPSGLVAESDQEYVYALRDGEEIRTGAVRLDDYNFQKPKVDLKATAAADQSTSLEYSDYPGEYTDKDVGSRYATVRLQEFQAQRRIQHMTASVRALLPGFTFKLVDHSTKLLNREYLVTRITHDARQPQSAEEEAGGQGGTEYKAEVRTIPSEVPFRPQRDTPRPVIHGTQTAIVVGPKGEELYTDKYGRVKVQFHWDRDGAYDENSSRWIRVSQGSAGGQYGMMFLPRVGQEVVVDFLEGDPDRPLITGRVYNNDLMPPYKLPDEKTKSTIKTHSSKGGGGTNEICFEDAKDKEQILIYAQKDLHIRVNETRVENVDKDRHLTVKENKFELVKKKKHAEVTLDFNEKVGGNFSLDVAGDIGQKVGGKLSCDVGADLYLKCAKNVVVEAAQGLTLKCGGNFVKIDSSGVTILGTKIKLNSGGAAGMSTAATVATPEKTLVADTATPGRDVTYTATPDEVEPVKLEERDTSWVEIELVDEQGQPWPGEPYEITYPDGKIRQGYLDDKGQAYIGLPKPIAAQVSFPKLDAEAWEQIR